MTAPLTPALALAYLHELSVDVRSAVVLDAAGDPLAGDAAIARQARELLISAGTDSAQGGALLVARTADGGAIAVLAGDFALAALLRHDLDTVAKALSGGPADLPGSRDSP
jgi:hypothetical protein